MAKTPPAFQFYYKDFMDAVCMWDAVAVGVYIRMLCVQYSQGGLPDDMDALERAVGKEVQSVWSIVSEKFPLCKDGFRRNAKLEEVRATQNEFRKSRQKAARTRWGKKKRAGKHAYAHASSSEHPHEVHIEVEDIREENLSGKERAPEVEIYPTFNQWWELYDKSRDKEACRTKWATLDQATRELIMTHTAAYVQSQPDKLYRKDPIRYLTKRAWNDEIVTTTTKPKTDGDYTQQVIAAAERRFAKRA